MESSLFRTMVFVAIAATLLVLIDGVLAKTERLETAIQAARFYREGQSLMLQGKDAEAADLFKSAIADVRDNAGYRLALGQALAGAGRLDEAEATLTELLKEDSMAGTSNLAMARLCAKQGRVPEAISYYHRAIYGQWKADERSNQVSTRFELADFLAARDSKAELLAELLPLGDMASAGAATQQRLARLYMTSGSPARAAPLFRDLVRRHPQDPQAHEELGEAEFARGNYSAAESSFLATLRLRPDDQNARRRVELCGQVLDLDPMRRGLNGRERYQRSIQVLKQVTDDAAQCPANSESDLAAAARAALKRHTDTAGQSDALESNMDLANRLWQAVRAKCTAANSPADEPLNLVLAKVAP